jgi:hypothetical protein
MREGPLLAVKYLSWRIDMTTVWRYGFTFSREPDLAYSKVLSGITRKRDVAHI